MRNTNGITLIGIVVSVLLPLAGFVPVCWAGSDKPLSGRELLKTMRGKDRQPAQRSGTRHTPANKSHPSASELLNKYAETQDKLQSLIIKYETSTYGASTSLIGRLPRIPKGGTGGFREKRFDGKRFYSHRCMWGHVGMRAVPIPRDKPLHQTQLWDGEVYFRYAVSEDKDKFASSPFGTVKIYNYKNNVEKGQNLYKIYTRLPLQGYCYEDKERVDVMLRQADNLSVRNKLERIGESDCYVIDAKGKHGTYRVWIDPAHGYNIAQAEVRRTTGDLRLGNPMGGKAKLFFSLKNIRFQKIDNVWIPMEADRRINQTYGGGRFWKSSGHTKRTEVIINPDHEALGSFVPDDIRNGAYVKIMDFPIKPHNIWRDGKYVTSAHFIWQDGKFVDEDGREVDVDKLIKAESEKVKKPKPKSSATKRPGIWDLVRQYAAQQAKAADSPTEERIVHFPEDKSIGRCFLVEPQPEHECLWNRTLVWPKTDVGHVRGDVNVPAGKMLRLDVWDAGPRAHNALAALGANDVQILNLYQCKKADDRMLSAASRLTGLKVLFLGQGRFTLKGLKHLTALRELRALQLPSDVPVESLEQIRNLTALRYLCISGPELTDAKMAKVGELPWLTQLGISAHDRSEGLRHIAKLKSLRYLGLVAVRNPNLDRHLAYIADLTELEEIDLEDSMIGDAGLQHLKGMIKLKKLDISNRSYPVSYKITDAGMVHLNNLKSLKELKLPYAGLTDIGLAQLAGLNALKKLNVGRDVTDEGMAALAKMKSLEYLDLKCPNITDAGLAELCRGSSLKSLSISRCKVTDAGLANVANLKSLEYFSVSNVPINGAGLAALKQCPSLREIALRFVELQSNAITHVAAIPSLEKLRLYHIGTPITDESLNQLSRLTNLKTLSIVIKETSQMPITDAGIAHLSRLEKLEDVWFNHCEEITDEELRHFEGLASLRHLRLDKSRVTKAGVDRLKEKIPGLSVTVPATMRPAGPSAPANPARRTGRANSTSRTTGRRR